MLVFLRVRYVLGTMLVEFLSYVHQPRADLHPTSEGPTKQREPAFDPSHQRFLISDTAGSGPQ